MTAARGESRFVSNTTALAISTVLGSVLLLAQVKILSGFLTRETFGLFAALRGLSLFVALLAANGLPALLLRFLPEQESRSDLRRAVKLAAICLGAVAGALVVGYLVVHSLEDRLFRSLPIGERTPEFFFWFFVVTFSVGFKLVLYGGLNGLRRLGMQTLVELLTLCAQVGWMYGARADLSVELLFRIIGTVNASAVIVLLPLFSVQLFRDVGRVPKSSSPAETLDGGSSWFRYWVGALGVSLVALAFSDVDRYVLTGVLTLEMLSLFHVATRVVRMVNRFLAIPVLSFQPEATRLDTEGRAGTVERSARLFYKFNVTASVFIAVAIAIYAREVIELISSSGYTDAIPLLVVLCASLPLTAMTAPITTVMKARDRMKAAFYCDLCWAVVYLTLLVALGRLIGLLGTGLAMVSASLAQFVVARRLGDVGIDGRAAFAPLGRALAAAALALLPAALSGLLPVATPVTLAARVACVPVAFWLFRVLVHRFNVFTGEERGLLSSLLASSSVGRIAGRLLS